MSSGDAADLRGALVAFGRSARALVRALVETVRPPRRAEPSARPTVEASGHASGPPEDWPRPSGPPQHWLDDVATLDRSGSGHESDPNPHGRDESTNEPIETVLKEHRSSPEERPLAAEVTRSPGIPRLVSLERQPDLPMARPAGEPAGRAGRDRLDAPSEEDGLAAPSEAPFGQPPHPLDLTTVPDAPSVELVETPRRPARLGAAPATAPRQVPVVDNPRQPLGPDAAVDEPKPADFAHSRRARHQQGEQTATRQPHGDQARIGRAHAEHEATDPFGFQPGAPGPDQPDLAPSPWQVRPQPDAPSRQPSPAPNPQRPAATDPTSPPSWSPGERPAPESFDADNWPDLPDPTHEREAAGLLARLWHQTEPDPRLITAQRRS